MRVFALLLLFSLLAGCSTSKPPAAANARRFDFARDTFAYPNELVWAYGYEGDGRWAGQRREPTPDYALHCFVVSRSAAQFFEHAQFDPDLPIADETAYRRLIRKIVSRSLKEPSDESNRGVIPGYRNLREFSNAREALLKAECGGYLQSYFQRGNWRMVFPFSRGHQSATLKELLGELARNRVAVVHVLCFPHLTINHAVVIYDAKSAEQDTFLSAYDPNDPDKPLQIIYDNATRTFMLPVTTYFPGGPVNLYRVYHRWNY